MTRADLIAKLEAAEGPSRELDAEIAAGEGWTRFSEYWLSPSGRQRQYHPPAYTSSLDAALTLVPEGYWWTAGDCRREKHARVAPEAIDDDGWEAFGATVALALCIAAIRARG